MPVHLSPLSICIALVSVCLCCLPNTEAPEEEYDGRSLFERLQEQKDKKQEEYDEQFKFSKGSSLVSLSFSTFLPITFWDVALAVSD